MNPVGVCSINAEVTMGSRCTPCVHVINYFVWDFHDITQQHAVTNIIFYYILYYIQIFLLYIVAYFIHNAHPNDYVIALTGMNKVGLYYTIIYINIHICSYICDVLS